ncbi:Xylose import ATP-binding protein XylG [compost metagenome]
MLSKWLEKVPRILILDEPTRGVDVGAKFEIYNVIRQLAAQGTAIILISSELPEVMALSDRLVVMRAKQIADVFATDGLTQTQVMTAATGVK